MSKYSQLTLKDRIKLEHLLDENFKLVDIAKELNRDPRGIKYEIVHHRQLFVRKNQKNKCGIQNTCKKQRLCTDCNSGLCKYCGHINCDVFCEDFQDLPQCESINRFPCVCNGCLNVKECHLPKLYYKAHIAQDEYQYNISEHKKGPRFDEKQLKRIDQVITDGVKKGHSIDVIVHTSDLDMSTSTVYRYIDNNQLSVKNIDLKRKVRYKPRKTKKEKAKPREYDYLKGRAFEDFNHFFSEHLDANIWQMDTIEGKKGESAVLSLLYTKTNLQLFFKIATIDTNEVSRVFDNIRDHLGTDLFKSTFECILTDNGKETKDPLSIEKDPVTDEVLTHVFYCQPRRSEQKGKCEKNHEHFREMIPKGKSMDGYGQKTIDHVSKHVNNYPRKKLNYNSPLTVSLTLLNKKVFELNNLSLLPIDKVHIKHLD